MPRTEVYQLRLTKPEKDYLADRANAEGKSIARFLREAAGLLPLKEDVQRPTIRTLSKDVAEGSVSPLTRQLQNQGYTKPVAERMARESLGLGS